MDLRSHVPPSGNPPRPTSTLASDMLIIDALLSGKHGQCVPTEISMMDAVTGVHLRLCAESLSHAIDAMGASPDECDHEEVCNQLERVQEAAGRAIMATLESRRKWIIAGEGDDADDAVDTMLCPEPPPADADEKGGVA